MATLDLVSLPFFRHPFKPGALPDSVPGKPLCLLSFNQCLISPARHWHLDPLITTAVSCSLKLLWNYSQNSFGENVSGVWCGSFIYKITEYILFKREVLSLFIKIVEINWVEKKVEIHITFFFPGSTCLRPRWLWPKQVGRASAAPGRGCCASASRGKTARTRDCQYG